MEDFGLIERAENLSTVVQFNLKHSAQQQSRQAFLAYSRQKDLKPSEIQQFERLILGMHLVQHQHQQDDERISLERLSDESGIPVTGIARAHPRIAKGRGLHFSNSVNPDNYETGR